MKIFFQLVKNNLFSGLNISNGKNKKKNRSSTLTLLVLALFFTLLSFFYNYSIMDSFYMYGGVGSIPTYLTLVLSASAMFTLLTSILSVNQTLYHTKDYEFLQSLPISKIKIVASKISFLYFFGLMVDLIIVLPAIILGLINGLAINIALLAFLFTLLISCVPLAISIFIGLIFTLLTAKTKFKSLINVILYLLFFAAIFAISFTASYTSSAGESGDLSMFESATSMYPLSPLILKAFKGEFLPGLAFVGISIVALGIVVLVAALTYHRINNWITSGVKHNVYVVGKQKGEKSISSSLIKKEMKLVLRYPLLLVNYIIMPIFGVAMMFFFALMGSSLGIEEVGEEEMALLQNILYSIAVLMVTMMIGMSSYSIYSISVEGRSFNVMKSLPVQPKDVILAKLKVSLALPQIFILVGSTIFNIVFKPELYVMIFSYILPTLSLLNITFLGMLCNLKWPVLEWDNLNTALKNNKASLISTFSCLGIGMVTFLVGIILIMSLPEYSFLSLLIPSVIFLIPTVIFGVLLYTKYEKLYSNIIA